MPRQPRMASRGRTFRLVIPDTRRATPDVARAWGILQSSVRARSARDVLGSGRARVNELLERRAQAGVDPGGRLVAEEAARALEVGAARPAVARPGRQAARAELAPLESELRG